MPVELFPFVGQRIARIVQQFCETVRAVLQQIFVRIDAIGHRGDRDFDWLRELEQAWGKLKAAATKLADAHQRALLEHSFVAWLYAVTHLFNAIGHTVGTILGHTVAGVTFPRPAPGFYSSPLLVIGSVWLMLRLRQTRPI